MDATQLNLDLLATFVAVASTESFSKAAKQLGVTKGTVSRAIARLERELGAELVHRTTHEVALSTAGTALYERVAPHVAALGSALGELPERAEEPSGVLRLTAAHDIAAMILPDVIAPFLLRYPQVRFDLRVTNARLNLVAEKLDLAIRAARTLTDSTLKARRLGSSVGGFYASPSYLARRGEPRQLGDPKHEWVIMSSALSLFRAPKDFHPRILVDDIVAARELAIAGAGVTMLPTFVTIDAVARGDLAPVLRARGFGNVGLFMVYPSSGQVPRKVTVFGDFLAARLRGRPLDAS